MVERGKSSPGLKATLSRNGIFFCFIEDFYDGNTDGIKTIALLNEVKNILDGSFQLTICEILEKALETTGIHLKDDEKEMVIKQHFSAMKITIDGEGKLSVAVTP